MRWNALSTILVSVLAVVLCVSGIVIIALATRISNRKEKKQPPNGEEPTAQPQAGPSVISGEEGPKYYDINPSRVGFQPVSSFTANDDYEEPRADFNPHIYVDVVPEPPTGKGKLPSSSIKSNNQENKSTVVYIVPENTRKKEESPYTALGQRQVLENLSSPTYDDVVQEPLSDDKKVCDASKEPTINENDSSAVYIVPKYSGKSEESPYTALEHEQVPRNLSSPTYDDIIQQPL